MTETPAATTDETGKMVVTCEGGPLDGSEFVCAPDTKILNALAVKAADGTWQDPRTWATTQGMEIPEDAPPRTWPPELRAQVKPVEYLVDAEHATAAFREPAIIRDAPEAEPDREWAQADPRKTQEARWIAWKAVATALDRVVGVHPAPDECAHTGKCTTYSMHVARVAIDAIIDDGLRIVEPTRLTDSAEALAALLHETGEALVHEDALVPVPWDQLPEEYRKVSVDVASQVLGSIDAQGRVVVVHVAETTPLTAEFEGLANVLRDEAGAALTLVLAPHVGITMQTLDEQEMRAEGWVRVPKPHVNEEAPPDDRPDGPTMLVTSCPVEHCRETFIHGLPAGVIEPDDGIAASRELASTIHEHLNSAHPQTEHTEVTIELIDTEQGHPSAVLDG